MQTRYVDAHRSVVTESECVCVVCCLCAHRFRPIQFPFSGEKASSAAAAAGSAASPPWPHKTSAGCFDKTKKKQRKKPGTARCHGCPGFTWIDHGKKSWRWFRAAARGPRGNRSLVQCGIARGSSAGPPNAQFYSSTFTRRLISVNFLIVWLGWQRLSVALQKFQKAENILGE